MGNTVDIIKGTIMQINMNRFKGKNKKIVSKLQTQLSDRFHEILREDNDEIFFDNFIKLITSQTARPYITSNFFPQNMTEYARYRNVCRFSNDFRYEIRWMISCILFEKESINDFVVQREKYDNYVLLNEYEDALAIIEGIENKYGTSYWVMESRFFLNSKLGKDNNELAENIPANVFGLVLNFYELKNREGVTSDEYFYIVEKEISNIRKHIKDYDDMIEFYNYYILGNAYQSEPEKIMLVLSVMPQCSLIDRYLFIIKICNELMNQPKTNYFYACMQAYIVLLKEIEDAHLSALRFVFDEEENRKTNYILKSRLDSAKSNFISGNLIQARAESIELLKLFPNNTGAMNLLVETNILIGDDEKQFIDTNLGMLLERLSSVYTLTEHRDDSVEDISKFANACSQSTWAQSIISSVMCRCHESKSFDYVHHKILSNLQYLDIETMIVSSNLNECARFIIEKLDENDKYVQFRKALLDNDYKAAAEICSVEQIKDYLFVCDPNNSTLEKVEHLYPIEGGNASIAVLTMREFLSSLNIEEHSELALQISTNLVVDNIYTSLFIPWNKIISLVDKGPSELRQNICTPILYYVYAYYIEKMKKDDLGIVCSDFFFYENIERPSAMSGFADSYEKKLLIYFLKNVCTSKIMDDAICDFSNTQERDKERVEICNVLSHIDSINAKEYEKEIREITKKLMINKELKSIDESRIHVNVEGIRDRLVNAEGTSDRFDRSLKNDFQRYLFYQDERVQQWTLFREGESVDKFRQLQNVPERILSELIFKIRDAFVSSDEYGLNGYLSLNIRHGTLDDELRSPLHKSMLYVRKDVSKNQYIINEHWINYTSEKDKQVLQKGFGSFYMATEGILAKLKEEYIQIRTESKNERGIFDYRLYDTDMLNISMDVNNIMRFEEFLDKIINYFWAITERNLKSIKYVITTEIAQNYIDAFNALKNDITQIENKNKLRELQQEISQAEIDMQNVLRRICHWFQRSNESKHNDFDLQFAFDLGLQTIKNMHPEKRFIADELEKTVSDKIPGRYLKSFDGIFYNLFDNIYKKAIPKNNAIRIGYSLKYIEGKIRIYIENDYDCTRDILDDMTRVKEAKRLYETGEYLERVNGEGGTGIPKICKIIKYDLKWHPDIDFGYKVENNIFFMEIKI